MKVSDIIGGRLNGRDMIEMKLNGVVVWPTIFDYVITNVVLVYSAGGNQIPASGGYAYFTGRVQQYVHGRPYKDLGIQTLTPHILSGDTSFFSVEGTNVKALSRGKTEGPQKGVMVGYSYATSEVSAGNPIYLQENAKSQKSQTRVTTGYSVSLSTAFVNPNANTINLSGTRTYTQTTVYEYTSLAEDTVTETGKTVAQLPTSVVFDIQTGVSYSSGTVSIANNYHNTSTRSWTLTATYDGFSDTASFMQGNDSYTDTIRKYDYYANISVASGQAYAYASNIYLGISAGHTEDTHRDWAYGEDEYINKQYKTDSVTPTESGDTHNRFSLSGSIVHHDSMGKDETTDYVKYTLTNGGVSNYIELSATNSKSSYVSDKEYGTPWTSQRDEAQNYTVSITANRYTSSSSPCPASGGTCTITTSASHEKRTITTTHTPWTKYNVTEWTSREQEKTVNSTGTDTSDSPGAWSSVSDTPSISLPAFATRSGNTITIASEGTTEFTTGRNGRITAINGVASDYVTLYQQQNILQPMSPVYRIWAEDTSNIPYGGGTRTLKAHAYSGTQWTSGEPGSTVPLYATLSVVTGGSYASINKSWIDSTSDESITLTVASSSSSLTRDVKVRLSVDYSGIQFSSEVTLTQSAKPSTYTFIPQWFGTTITPGQTIRVQIATTDIIDEGVNLRQYSVVVEDTAIGYTISGNKITFDDITSSTMTDVTITEASSGKSITFTIEGT